MKNFKYFVFLFFCIFFIATNASAQKVGTTSMQFLKVMPCARATALGDAYSVLASGAEAVFWNPSGVALTQNHDFSSTYIVWIFDAKQGALSYAASLGDIGALGLQIQYIDYGMFDEAVAYDIINDKSPYLTGRQFSAYSYLVGLTYAKNLTDKFSTGVTVKYARESLFDSDFVTAINEHNQQERIKTYANAFLFDFGIRYNTGFRSVQIGATVQNFGSDITYAKESNPAPLQFRVGVAADLIGPNSLLLSKETQRVGIAFDLFQPNDYAQQVHAGVEYEYIGVFALRMGYKFNYDTEGLAFGGGIQQMMGDFKFAIDYSYGAMKYSVGNVHRISLGVELQ